MTDPGSGVSAASALAAAKKKAKPFAEVIKDEATSVAKSLAGSALTAVGGAVLAPVFEDLFPSEPPAYFGEVYEEIRKIFQQELAQATIDHINGTLHNVGRTLQLQYRSAKTDVVGQGSVTDLSEEDRNDLAGLLRPCVDAFVSGSDGMLGTLQDERYDKAGFNAFLMGAGLHLAVMQEQAAIAHDKLRSSMLEPETGGIANMARSYAEAGERIWQKVYQGRLAEISKVEKSSYPSGPPMHATHYVLSWKDMGQEMEYKDFGGSTKKRDQAKPAMQQSRDAYYNQIAANLRETYHQPTDIIAGWRSLVATPLRLA